MFKERKPGRTFAKDAALEIHLLRHQHIEPFSLTIRQGEIFGFVGQRQQYVVTHETLLYQRHYVRMVKTLANG